jgi:hypothetical protein
VFPGGGSVVHFSNKDVKHTFPDGKVEHFSTPIDERESERARERASERERERERERARARERERERESE